MKQIRVYVDDKSYEELKSKAKEFRLTLAQYSGIKLSGFDVVKSTK